MAVEKRSYLYEDFYYGMPKKDVRKKISMASDGENKSLQLTNPAPAEFAGQKWQEIFNFNNLGELQEVILAQEGQIARKYAPLLQTLQGAGWQPAYYENGKTAFDLLAAVRQHGLEAAEKLRADFMRKAISEPDYLTVTFFPAAFLAKVRQNAKIKTWNQAVDKAPENFCQLTLMTDADNIKLSFTTPLLARKNALRYGEMIRRN